MQKLRVYYIPQVGSSNATFYVPVSSVEEARKIMDILACYDLFQLENKIKSDFCNASGLQMFDEELNEWVSWETGVEDDWFDSVDEYFENDDEMQEYTNELFSQLKQNK